MEDTVTPTIPLRPMPATTSTHPMPATTSSHRAEPSSVSSHYAGVGVPLAYQNAAWPTVAYAVPNVTRGPGDSQRPFAFNYESNDLLKPYMSYVNFYERNVRPYQVPGKTASVEVLKNGTKIVTFSPYDPLIKTEPEVVSIPPPEGEPAIANVAESTTPGTRVIVPPGKSIFLISNCRTT
jgi:hypothetical protein